MEEIEEYKYEWFQQFKKVLDIQGIQHQKVKWSKEKIYYQNAVSEVL